MQANDTNPTQNSAHVDEAPRGQKRPLVEEEILPSGRRRILPRLSIYPICSRAGRHLTRTEEPFDAPSALVNAAITRSNNELEGRVVTYSPEDLRRQEVYDRSLGANPVLNDAIMTAEADRLVHIIDAIRHGAQLGRSDDTMLLKRLATTWVQYKYGEKAPHLDRKHERGFNNRSIGEELAPVEHPLTDEYLARLRDGTATIMEDDEERLVNEYDYRHFMFAQGKYFPADPLQGFLKGEKLVKGYKAVFTCPSSADIEDPSLARSTKRGNAAINDMRRVTPSSIAYITVQVYFALSSRTVFSPTCAPEILEMYQGIMAFFRSDIPYLQRYAQELIEWWNNQIFPSHARILERHGRGTICRLEAKCRGFDADGNRRVE